MTQTAKAQEPSMEEILASIRRIIADDDASKSALRAPESPQAQAQPVPPVPPPPPAYSAPPPPPVVVPRPNFESESRSTAEPPSAVDRSPMEDESTDILDLTESMAAPMPQPPAVNPSAMPQPAPQFRTIDGSSDVGFDEVSEKPAPVASYGDDERGRLISSETSAAVDSAFNVLAQTVLVKNARTLEDLVREMLRPMLKTWLDDNLPGMVERLVRAEIERVSRGRSS